MSRKTLLKLLCAGALPVLYAGAAHGQGGSCKDPWINQAYNQLYHRAPSGAGLSGECNITLYGGGRWSTYNDLVSKVQAVKGAPSAASLQRPAGTTRLPIVVPPSSATAANNAAVVRPEGLNQNRVVSGKIISQDGGSILSDAGANLVGGSTGTFRSVQSVDKPHAPAGKYLVLPGGNLVDANGNVIRAAGTYTIVVRNGVNAIGAGGRAPVAGTVVTP